MIAIQPLAALIALAGLSGLIRLIPEKLPWAKKSFAIMVATFVAIFPFFSSPAAIHSKDLELTTDQKCLVELKPWFVEQNFSGVLHYYDHPSVAWIFDLDPFDSLQSRHLLDLATIEPTPGSIMIWDSWFAVNEAGVSAGFWEIDGKYELLKCVERTEYGKHSKVCIWRKR
ncbi:MAG TPA: hypothetical protein ENJ82_10435 [Bacteroidetes bacterium]|nr:hypothetical protein [Bacteroidota bacterium]